MAQPRFALVMDSYLGLPACERFRPVPRPPGAEMADIQAALSQPGPVIVTGLTRDEVRASLGLPPLLIAPGNTLHVAPGSVSVSLA